MPDLTHVMDRLRMRTDEEGAARIIEEYALERAQPLLDALEKILDKGTFEDRQVTSDAVIARNAISAWNERK